MINLGLKSSYCPNVSRRVGGLLSLVTIQLAILTLSLRTQQANAQDLYVGSNSSAQITNIISGTNSFGSTYVGYSAGDSSNLLTVGNTNTLLTNSADLYVGYNGSGNSMVISNGAQVINNNGWIGYSNTVSSNSVLVTGSGSHWSNSSAVVVGGAADSTQNSLTIYNGGAVLSGSTNGGGLGGMAGVVGLASGTNFVLVSGQDSTWNLTGDLAIGFYGQTAGSNSLLISSGGKVIVSTTDTSVGAIIGVSSVGNSVIVTDSNSLWSNNCNLYIGYSAYGQPCSNNSLVISNGGTVDSAGGSIGFAGSGNTVIVTGGNSLWNNSGSLVIGDSSGSGTLTVANGGTVSAINGIMIASGNEGTLNIGSYGGSDTAGAITTPSIYFGSGTGTINFNQVDTATLTSSISGTGTINQLGTGTTILSGPNGNFIGATTISAGTLQAASAYALGGSAVTLGGAVSTATIALSTDVTLSSLIWATNGVVALTPGSQILAITGAFSNANGTNDVFNLGGYTGIGTNTLITFGSYSGFTTNDFSVLGGGMNWRFILTANSLEAYFYAGPYLYVGFNSSGITSNITSGTNSYGTTCVGYNAGDSNNLLTVGNTNTLLTNSYNLYVGYNGSENSMVISNGAQVINNNGWIGYSNTASKNAVLVTDSGTQWANSGDLTIGKFGSDNSLVISNGGSVSVSGTTYGAVIGSDANASGNSVLVIGTNADGTASYLSDAMDLFVGYSGSSNTMTIKGGGQVGSANGWIGYSNIASSNSVLATDTGSLWQVTGDLFVGGDGSGNSLVISNGALVSVIGSTNGAVIGLNSESSNNSVLVTGTDGNGNASTLSIETGYDLVVGCAGSSNTLTINGGALLSNDNGWIGYSNTAVGNSVLVSGSGSLWTNVGDLYVGANGSGNTLVIQGGGQVYVDGGASNRAVIGYGSNASGNSVLVNGGSLNIGADTNGGYASADLYIGYNGKSNSLVLSNGGQVYVTGATIGTVIGYGSNSSGNQVLVSGSDSSGSASSLNVGGDKYGDFYNEDLYIGYYGSSNSLVISNGGQVCVSGAQYGTVIGFDSNSTGNSVMVTGAGSALTNKADLIIGNAGGGTLTVASGGTVLSDSSIIIAATNGAVGTINIGTLGGSDIAGTIVTPSIAFGSGAGTINFNQIDTVALTSSISGLGTIQQLGVGTTILSGSNSYTGSTMIANGTLVAASTNALGGSDITLGGGSSRATLQLATNLFLTSAPTPHNDLIWGSNGAIELTPGSQTLNLTHNMTNAGGGTFSFLNLSLNNSTNVLINFGSQSGFTTNSFSVQGISGYSFALTSTNVSTYIAPTANIVVSTVVTIAGTITASNLTIASGGTISGNGILNGNLNLQKGSAFVLNDSSSPMTVNGTATLGGSLVIASPMAFGTKQTFLSATTVVGTFDSVLAPAGYRGRVVIEGDPTVSVIMAPASYTQMAQNQNQVNVATALNSFIPYTSGDQLVISTSLDSLTASQYNQAFNAIMPTFYQQMATIAFNEANALNMELNQRLWGVRLAEGGGFSMSGLADNYPMIQEGQGDGSGKGVLDSKKDILRPGLDNHWGMFLDGNGIFAQANSANMLPGYNSESGGITTGLTYKWNDKVASGIYAGYQGTYTKSGANGSGLGTGSSLTDNAVRFGVFGTYGNKDGKGLYLNGLAGGAYHNYQATRVIQYTGVNRTANSQPGAGELDSMLATGYDIQRGKFTFGPTASLQYTYLGVNSLNETGAQSLNYNSGGWNSSSMLSSVGAHAAYNWVAHHGSGGDIVVVPQINLNWQHEFMQNPYDISGNLGGTSPTFSNWSAAPIRDFLYTGVGFTVDIGKRWNTSFFYNAAAGNQNLTSQNIFWSAGVKF